MKSIKNIYSSVAGFNIEITLNQIEWPFQIEQSFYGRLNYFFDGQLLNKKPGRIDFTINVITREKFETVINSKSRKHFINIFEESSRNSLTTFYHISNAQLSLVVRSVCQTLLAKNKGLIMHASASLVNDHAYVFMGDSGAGKSTITKLISSSFQPLADDSIILKEHGNILKKEGQYVFYQVPSPEKNAWIIKSSQSYPLGKIFFLHQSKENKIVKIEDPEEVKEKFLKQLHTEEDDVKNQLKTVLGVAAQKNLFYDLHFNLNDPKEVIYLLGNHERK